MREIRTIIKLLATSEGGREAPISGGYRPALWIGDRQTDGAVFPLDRMQAHPGEEFAATVRLLHPEALGDALTHGAVFEIREGLRVVARGRVTEVVMP